MTVIDVNTGKFTGQGGNLEETVTRNNLEAAEEIVRQLRLRDVGGIVVIDFIDMVLESNRELVLRRLLECLARDRTKHQVAEVTSLGLVQMTRKRVGAGLLEAFSVPCECCNGRGVHVSLDLTDLGQPGPGCQQATPAGGHARGGKHDNRRADEPAGRRRGGDNGNPSPGGGDSAPEGDGAKGRGGESKPAGSSRRRRGGQNRAAADSASPSDVTATPEAGAVTEAGGVPEASGAPNSASAPDAMSASGTAAVISQNGTAPHGAAPVPGPDPVSGPEPAVEPQAPAGGTAVEPQAPAGGPEVVAPFRAAGSEPVAGQEPAAPGPETVTE
jgi:ribonuclease E